MKRRSKPINGEPMSKSFEWVKARASNPNVSGLADRDWNKAVEYDAFTIFKKSIYGESENGVVYISVDGKQFCVHFLFDANAEYDYFTGATELNDGTFFFESAMCLNIADKVCTLQTVNKEKIAHGINFSNVYWTIGNFAVLSENGDKFASRDKPWMKTRLTAVLPLKMEVK